MKKKILISATLLALSAGTMTASATPTPIKGSDTLEPPTTEIIASKCSGASLATYLNYIGGGSGGGNDNMKNAITNSTTTTGGQLVAPMSSGLGNVSTEAHCAATNGTLNAQTTAQGMVVAVDGLALVMDSDASQDCGSSGGGVGQTGHAPRTGTSAPTAPFSRAISSGTTADGLYTVSGAAPWQDVLKLLYLGIPANGTSLATQDCGGTARRQLVANYANLFQGGCATNTLCTTGIKHAYRRNDLSGTTDTFLKLVGAPSRVQDPVSNAVTSIGFCNGLEFEDNDPIRQPCDKNEQVCEYDGTLGLVLAISVPTNTNDVATLYNDPPVTFFGRFQGAQRVGCSALAGPQFVTPGVRASTKLTACVAASASARCDCRFPVPNDFVACNLDHNGNGTGDAGVIVAEQGLRNDRFKWNLPFGNKCQATATDTTAAATNTANGWNRLNGDDGTRDNTPTNWGTKYDDTAGSTGLNAKCCNITYNGAPVHATMDPRLLNLFLRNKADGTYMTTVPTGVTNPPAGNPAPTFHRIHTNSGGRTNVQISSTIGVLHPTPVCQKVDATDGIGCLVVSAPQDNCSVGYAGIAASDEDFADRAAINSIDPTQTTIQLVVTNPATAYPLSRKLYINSLIGFGNLGESTGSHTGNSETFLFGDGTESANQLIANAQYNLAKCFYTDYKTTVNALANIPSVVAKGFIALPANAGKPFCENACGNTSCSTTNFDTVFSR